jgi:putative DNA primase/helicase
MTTLDALASLPRWIAWRNEERNGKPTKVPYAPQGGKAKADDPLTWSVRVAAEAQAARIANGSGGGIGIQLGDLGDGTFLAGIDLDSCLDDDGVLAPWATPILHAVTTYAEKSPSGRGVKLFFRVACEAVRPFLDRIGVKSDRWGCCRDAPGEDARDHGPAVEVYLSGRYFAVTDDVWSESPDHLSVLDSGQLKLLAELIPPAKSPGSSNRDGNDNSRSARAFCIGLAMHSAGKTFEGFCEAVRTDPEAASWYAEKGILNDGRELHRIWDKAAAEAEHGLDLLRVSEIIAQPVRWLWPGRIARGKVTILAGHPGLAKSQLALWFAATVTTAGLWPVDGTRAEAGSAVILSAEDGPEDTIRPRSEAARADLTRCHILRAVRERKGGTERVRGFSLADDLMRLEKALAGIDGVALVIIDPISAYLGSIDAHNNAQVRGLLGPLAELATRCGVAVLAISHLSKAREGDAFSRVSGSLGFVAAARAVYMVTSDPDDGERRLFLPAKNNPGDDRTGYAYHVEPVTLPSGIETSRIVWASDAVTVTVDEAFTPRNDVRPAPSRRDTAGRWLREMLAGGPVPMREIEAEAKGAGFSWATVRRAADDLGIVPKKTGFDAGWAWRLPDRPAVDDEGDE